MNIKWLEEHDTVSEAYRHLERIDAMLKQAKSVGKIQLNALHKEDDIETLQFAIDFIKWGMK
jgi:hypothetical protein